MSHEEVQEELPLFAAGASEADVTQAVRAHLRTCPECRRSLADLETALTLVVDGSIRPDRANQDRMQSEFADLLRAQPKHGPRPDTDPDPVGDPAPRPGPPFGVPQVRSRNGPATPFSRWAWPVVWAATVLVAIGGWSAVYRDQVAIREGVTMTALATRGTRRQLSPLHDTSARVTLYLGKDAALVDVRRLPKLGPNEVYEGWWITGTKATPAGTFREGPHLLGRLPGARAFAITVEPSGGTSRPTTPVLALSPV